VDEGVVAVQAALARAEAAVAVKAEAEGDMAVVVVVEAKAVAEVAMVDAVDVAATVVATVVAVEVAATPPEDVVPRLRAAADLSARSISTTDRKNTRAVSILPTLRDFPSCCFSRRGTKASPRN
jgi:hypothetical protein